MVLIFNQEMMVTFGEMMVFPAEKSGAFGQFS